MGTLLSRSVDSDNRLSQDYHHIPSTEDVETVRRYLMYWVPAELANAIIDDAQYWTKVNYAISSPNDSWTIVTEAHSPCCFFLTPKLSEIIGLHKFVRIRKVGFKITSHDQGFCSENHFPSKYLGSWTWFEAAIAREVEVSPTDSTNEQPSSDDSLESRIRSYLDEKDEELDAGMEIVTVKNPQKAKSSTWYLQRNIRASRADAIHEVIWSDEGPDEFEEDEMAFIDMTGAGKGLGFVRLLGPDDRIVVFAFARFNAWINYIREVEVEVYYSD